MSCEICGRGSCSRSFHSIDDQNDFDGVADKVKDRAKEYISHRLNRLDFEYIGNDVFIKLDDAVSVVDDYT